MPKFQIIMTSLTGLVGDGVIVRGSLSLQQKAESRGIKSTNVEVQPAEPHYTPIAGALIRQVFGQILRSGGALDARLYLRGHGCPTTVGGMDGESWALLLKELNMPQMGIVSVTGCQAGLHVGNDVMDCFAAKFHRALKAITGVKCDVYARTEYLGVQQTGKKMTSPTMLPGTYRSKSPGSKYKFTWGQGGTQARVAVY